MHTFHVACLILMIAEVAPARHYIPHECNLHPDPDPHFFRQIAGKKVYRQRCALGTLFSAQTCQCSIFDHHYYRVGGVVHSTKHQCSPYFTLPFTVDVHAKDNTIGIDNLGVKIVKAPGASDEKAAYFDGHSRIKIWALNDMEFGDNFVLTLRFVIEAKKASVLNGAYALVDNSGCGKNASFGLALGIVHGHVTLHGGVRLTTGQTISKSVLLGPSVENHWQDVVMMKTHDTFILTANGKGIQVHNDGRVKRRQCEMRIGKGWGLQNFVGLIDEVRFYKCVPDYMKV